MQVNPMNHVFLKDPTPDHVRAIMALTTLRNIIRDHKLDQFYENAMSKADQEINKMGDTTQAARHGAFMSLKENMMTFDQWNINHRDSNQSFRYPETAWEMKTKKFLKSIIPAVKTYREISGKGLHDSKIAVEAIMEEIYSGKIEI